MHQIHVSNLSNQFCIFDLPNIYIITFEQMMQSRNEILCKYHDINHFYLFYLYNIY